MNACSRCGTTVPEESRTLGMCPECVSKFLVETQPAADTDLTAFQARLKGIEILGRLGAGGMGVVYKARQTELDRVVALKVLATQWGSDPEFVARFRREARTMASLAHPNIVGVYDFGYEEGHGYLVMEYVEGVNLRQILSERRLKSPEALRIIHQICDALEYAHGKGIVHRDIKPENILIDKGGQVKIADFGLAIIFEGEKRPERITQSNVVLGTPSYMAPEQMEKPGQVDHRADIYSLGVVFYEMLTGELPMGRFLPPSQKVEVDVRLDEVVLRALEKERELRYQRVTEVRTDLEGLRRPIQVEVKHSSPIWPWVVLGGIAAVCFGGLLMVGAGAFLLRAEGVKMPPPRVKGDPRNDPPPKSVDLNLGRKDEELHAALARARRSYENGEFAKALDDYTRARMLDPENEEAQAGIARAKDAIQAVDRRNALLGNWKGKWSSTKHRETGGALDIDTSHIEGKPENLKIRFRMTGGALPVGEAECEVVVREGKTVLTAKEVRVGERTFEATCVFTFESIGSRGVGTFQIDSPELSDAGTFEVERP